FPYQPTSVTFGPDSKTLVTVGFDDGFGAMLGDNGGPGQATLWDLDQLKETASFGRGEDMYFSVISPDAKLLVTEHQREKNSFFGGIALWDLTQRKKLFQMGGSESGVRSLALSRDGKVLAAGYYDGKAR